MEDSKAIQSAISSDDFVLLNLQTEVSFEMEEEPPETEAVFEKRKSTSLTKTLLKNITQSIATFRPSSSLFALTSLTKVARDKLPATEIDIVISGGGLKGYFMAGCAHVLLEELKKQNINIARIAGASAGAWAGMFMLCDFDTSAWIETYHACRVRPNDTIHEVYEDIKDWVISLLPYNAFEICTGRLFISVTEITVYGPRNKMISEFSSNYDLIDCCMASSTIPYITERRGLRRHNGMLVCDGGFTNNCPVFPDGERRQLVFRLFEVEYPYRCLINPVDTCIDVLVIRGALLMARFLDGEPTDAIAWLEKRERKTDLKIRPNYFLRGLVIAPATVMGIMLFRGSGLAHAVGVVRDLLGVGAGGGAGGGGVLVIPFHEAAKHFDPAPLKYLAGTLLAALVDALRALNLLL